MANVPAQILHQVVLVVVLGREEARDAKVHIRVPVALVDALLSGPEDELDLQAALTELENMGRDEIVRVDDGRDTVRIWID